MASDTPCADPPLLKVSGPAELAHAVPYLLGFHPQRSLVLIGLRDRRVVVTARADLDHVADATLLGRTVEAMLRSRVQSFVGLVFDDTVPSRDAHGALAWTELADTARTVVDELGSRVDELALVSHERMWSYDCDDSRCCPPEGRPIEGTSPVAAAAAYAGLVALPDRAALAATLTCALDEADLPALQDELAGAERQAVSALLPGVVETDDRAAVRALFAAARDADRPGAVPQLALDELARFAVALRRFEVRDAVWVGIDDKRIDGRALWRHLGTHLPAPYCAAPLFLFAWASWRGGNGALAGIAADLAVAADPEYTAADLVRGALDSALDPALVPPLSGSYRATRAERRAARRAGADRRRR